MAAVEAPDDRSADDDDQDQVGDQKADERNAEQHRQRVEFQRIGGAGKQRGEGCERHRIALRVGQAEDQPAPQRFLHGDQRPVITFRSGAQSGPADPAEIEAAEQPENVEDRRADRARADDRNQRQRRPEDVAGEMPAHEQGACLAALAGTDAEQGQKSRPGNERIGEGGEKGTDQQRLGHGRSPVVSAAIRSPAGDSVKRKGGLKRMSQQELQVAPEFPGTRLLRESRKARAARRASTGEWRRQKICSRPGGCRRRERRCWRREAS
ncbi:hypothetical protein D9M72_518210 [compost metagenome]